VKSSGQGAGCSHLAPVTMTMWHLERVELWWF